MKIKSLLFIVSILACSLTAHASVTIVTDKLHPLHNIPNDAEIIMLDDSIELHATLSDNLPNDPVQAEQLVKARLTALANSYQQNMKQALQGALAAYQLGVIKIPAVIQDNRYVVYGESDVLAALALIKQRGQDEP
ncbi:integrating conjugative element protein [Gilliamella sp. Fer1-1]|jgi:integrating conjugative element protein (TIGR03757 family)|uniref:TIGR03757 family integrating conjugative element protein n=1 Tax=Gilliamella sp. Fer1-1 TaxID=3120240 RepID=UPI00080E0E76|nr:TIGR03757 family integrating conjugative element protein [Gilliamella apicola]OCG41172.1 integrating conjugative element protein [Gilliamella apicola]